MVALNNRAWTSREERLGDASDYDSLVRRTLQATVFHCLGQAAHTEVRDTQGRPLAITRGEVIRQAV